LERPRLCNTAKRFCADLSPVNILPVLFPPWAAGARPTIIRRAPRSPQGGTGFAQ